MSDLVDRDLPDSARTPASNSYGAGRRHVAELADAEKSVSCLLIGVGTGQRRWTHPHGVKAATPSRAILVGTAELITDRNGVAELSLRGRRETRREERRLFGRGGTAVRYRMRQKMFSIGDDYWIENDAGERMFRIDGKALRLRQTLDLEDSAGEKLFRIQKRVMRVRDTMEIEGPDGGRQALVHKALITPFRGRWKVDVEDGPDLEVQGNVVDHEYRIEAGGRKVAEVSKKWFRVRDTYGVEIDPDRDVPLLLAVTVAIEAMAHPGR